MYSIHSHQPVQCEVMLRAVYYSLHHASFLILFITYALAVVYKCTHTAIQLQTQLHTVLQEKVTNAKKCVITQLAIYIQYLFLIGRNFSMHFTGSYCIIIVQSDNYIVKLCTMMYLNTHILASIQCFKLQLASYVYTCTYHS